MRRVLFLAGSPESMKELSAALAPADPIEILGTQKRPSAARDELLSRLADVVVVDLDELGRQGACFVGKVMHYRPLPVLVVVSMEADKADLAVESLILGAWDTVPREARGGERGSLGMRLKRKILEAVSAQIPSALGTSSPVCVPRRPYMVWNRTDRPKVVGIAASVGGIVGLRKLLVLLPKSFPPIILSQTLPPVLIESFAKKLGRMTSLRVKVAQHGEALEHGHLYIVPSGHYLNVLSRQDEHFVALTKIDEARVGADVADKMFRSLARAAQSRAVGIVLSGTGSDGAKGLLAMRQKGALTVAQDASSSMCYELPGSAVAGGGVEREADLEGIARLLLGVA